MGKGMKAGRRKRPDNKERIVRQSELEALDAKIDRAKVEAETSATKYMQCLMYLAIHRVFGFGPGRIGKIMAEIDNIYQDFVNDPNYSWTNVYQELADAHIIVDGVRYDENRKVIGYDL